MGTSLDQLSWPLHTQRLSLRPAAQADLEATWRFRRLEEVSRWITAAPDNLADYRARFEDPDWLAKTLLFELEGVVIGDLMLAVEDAWAQTEVAEQARGVQAELGWCLDPRY